MVPNSIVNQIQGEIPVNIEFEGYAKQEHGYLEGKIFSISQSSADNITEVVVDLSAGLVTSSEEEVQFKYGLMGKAAIVIDDVRLVRRLFENSGFDL